MDEKGQTGILGAGITAVVSIIVILIVAVVYDSIPKSNLSSGTQSLLTLLPLVLAGATIIAVIVSVMFRGGR